jgi:hypothetical protein
MDGTKGVTTAKNKYKFHQATSNISGTAEALKRQLKQVDAGWFHMTTCMLDVLAACIYS